MSDEKWLRQAAEEIRKEGHYGWGNTCEQAADRIAVLEAENQRARDEVTRLEGIIARWGEHTQMYEARIAELEAACEKAEYELDWHSDELRTLEAEEQLFNKTFDAQQAEIEELRAENARLREGMENVPWWEQFEVKFMGLWQTCGKYTNPIHYTGVGTPEFRYRKGAGNE